MMDLSLAAQDVFAERKRQVDVEGVTPDRDDRYARNELPRAAACYAFFAGLPNILRHRQASVQKRYAKMQSECRGPAMPTDLPEILRAWPFSCDWWKPKDRRSDLVRAAALLIAEIERLDRAAAKVEVKDKQ